MTTVSAASFALDSAVSPEAIVAAFGVALATRIEEAKVIPLPTTLAGTTVKVKDSTGTERSAPLFFVAPTQVNYQIPLGTANGFATITITSGDGKISIGTVQIAKAAPGLFTANALGNGVPAGYALRVKPDFTQIPDQVSPLSFGPDNEQLLLVLFGTGIRGRNNLADVTVQIGGEKVNVLYAGEQGSFAGLDQINIGPVPRTLIGRGKVEVALIINGFGSANKAEIEIAGTGGASPPQVNGYSDPIVFAGAELAVNGVGFSSNMIDNFVRIGSLKAKLLSATPTQLKVSVPYGAETASVSVQTPGGEGHSSAPLRLRNSISGVIQNTALDPLPLKGVTIRLRRSNNRNEDLIAVTENDGTFILRDIPAPNSAQEIEIDGSTAPAPSQYPYPSFIIKMPTIADRDNPVPTIYSQQIIGPGIQVGAVMNISGQTPNLKAIATAEPDQTGRTGNVIFEVPSGTTAVFPNGATSGTLNLTLIENQRTPVKLPPNIFSSAIVQITEFGVKLNPGGKLTFPNTDKLPAGTQATLYRLDQTRGSATIGEFIDSGKATISADGLRIETEPNAIKETSIYFVAAPRPTTTVTGRVVDGDGKTPVQQARVECRSQEAFTDGNGGFIIRNVVVNEGDLLSVEASFQRTGIIGGRVDRKRRSDVLATINGVTSIGDMTLPSETDNRKPVVLFPTNLTMAEDETRNINFFAGDPDPGQHVVTVEFAKDLPFVTVMPIGNDIWNMRLAPVFNNSGTYSRTLTATDNLGNTLSYDVILRVNSPIIANAQTVTLPEDTSKTIQLTGNDPSGLPLSYTIVSNPKQGQLSGIPPSLTYKPKPDYSGSDSFSFLITNGFSISKPATVSIIVSPINDPPLLSVTDTQVVDEGKTLSFTISAFDPDTGDTLTFSATNLPPGAPQPTKINPTSAQFVWTPDFTQAGVYKINFTVRDDGTPQGSDSKTVTITVNDIIRQWTKAGTLAGGQVLEGGQINALFTTISNAVLAGTDGGGAFRSTDNGQSWKEVLTNEGVSAFAANGATLFAGGSPRGVFRSTDQGQTWTRASNGLTDDDDTAEVTSLVVVSNMIFAGTLDRGLFRSINDGQNWEQVNTEGLSNIFVRSLATNGSTLYAGTRGGGVFRSTNQGQSWTSTSLKTQNIYALAATSGTVYAGALRPNAGIYRSTDSGQTWVAVNSGLPSFGSPVTSLKINGTNVFAGTSVGVYQSTINSQTWAPINTGLSTAIYSLEVSGNNLLAGSAGSGVFRSANNGAAWTSSSTGLTAVIINTLAVTGNNLIAGTRGSGLYRSVNNGQNWVAITEAEGLPPFLNILTLAAVSNNLLFAGIEGSGIYRSTDQGQSWTPQNTGLNVDEGISVTALVFKDVGMGLFIGTDRGVFRSVDQGQKWTPAGLPDIYVESLAVSGSTLFVGTEAGGAFRSMNDGQSWEAINTGLVGSTVKALNANGNNLFAGTFAGVFLSTNQGLNWTGVNVGLTYRGVAAFLINETTTLVATSGGGVFRLDNKTMRWNDTSSGLTNRFVFSLATDTNNRRVFAGTAGGVFIGQ